MLKYYNSIQDYYGDKRANRSGVPYIKHIDDGLRILEELNADYYTKEAYCLHPIFQSDQDLLKNIHLIDRIDSGIMTLVMEYRSVANEYLSKRKIVSIDEIRLSPLIEVNKMLLADKLQNFSDFILYHYGTHERSDELYIYFSYRKSCYGSSIRN